MYTCGLLDDVLQLSAADAVNVKLDKILRASWNDYTPVLSVKLANSVRMPCTEEEEAVAHAYRNIELSQCHRVNVPKVRENSKLRGRSPQAKYTDRATAACRRN
jgi:hypothetical protein